MSKTTLELVHKELKKAVESKEPLSKSLLMGICQSQMILASSLDEILIKLNKLLDIK